MRRTIFDWMHLHQWVPWLVTLILLPAMLWPTSWWFTVDSLHINSTHAGEPATMIVERRIVRPFYGHWHTTIRQWDGGGWVTWCNATGASNYKPDAMFPKNLNLRWWTDGQCDPLPVGRYKISTTWVVKSGSFLPDKSVSIDSNIFEVGD